MVLLLKFKDINKKPLFAFLICVIYAISDEIHQLFVPGRTGQLKDVIIDSSGSFVGIAIVIIVIKLLEMKRNRKKRIKSI